MHILRNVGRKGIILYILLILGLCAIESLILYFCMYNRFFCLCGSSFQTLNGQRKHIEAHLESSNKGKRKVGEGFAIVHAPSQMESFHSVSGASSSLKIDEQSSSIHIIADENHCVKELKEE